MNEEAEFDRIASWQKRRSQWWNARHNHTAEIGSLVSGIIKKTTPKQEQFTSVSNLWRKIAGETYFCHTKVKSLNNGVLKIAVDSPSWMYQLQLQSKEFVEKFNRRRAGMRVRSIKFELCI